MRLYWETLTTHGQLRVRRHSRHDRVHAERSRKGYHLNQFCMSLMKAANRERFKADERAYLDEWPMTEEQKQAVLDRDYNAMIAQRRQHLLPGQDLRHRRPQLPAGRRAR